MRESKITSMTPEQWKALFAYREQWYQIGSATGSTDRAITQSTISAMYAALGHMPPRFLWLQSPMSALLAYGILQTQLGDQLGDCFYGHHDAFFPGAH